MACGRLLDLVQPEVGPYDPPTPKTLGWTKHEVDRMTGCGDFAIRNFPHERSVDRSSVAGRSSILCLQCYTYISYSRSLHLERSARGVKNLVMISKYIICVGHQYYCDLQSAGDSACRGDNGVGGLWCRFRGSGTMPFSRNCLTAMYLQPCITFTAIPNSFLWMQRSILKWQFRPSVCLSLSGTASEQLNISSKCFHRIAILVVSELNTNLITHDGASDTRGEIVATLRQ